MNHKNFAFLSKDGLMLFGRAWLSPHPEPKGVVNLVHGLGEHSGRYSHVAEALNQAGYHLFGFDLRGHGLSKGKKGHASSYNLLLGDIDTFLNESQKQITRPLPSFLYGHSLGGNLVINYGMTYKENLAGVIATAPALKLSFEPSKLKLRLGKWLANIFPALTLSNDLEIEALARDKAVVKAYKDDPYVHDRVSTILALEMLESGQYALDHAHLWHPPLLLMHGTADRITSHHASREFAEKGNGNIRLKTWEGYYHEIHNDIGKEKVIAQMINWLDEKTQ